ncbi:hypothetical protein LTR27_001206 [Elasticomyces elasticus]|nr:hypothetical protein LTR27_001206 [Elasticomyces elasticus]
MDPTRVLRNGLERLRDKRLFTDLTISCGTKVFEVHKALVCAQSGYFRNLCSNSAFHGSQVTITLGRLDDQCSYLSDAAGEHDDEQAVQHMIDFFYSLGDPVPEYEEGRLTTYAQLFAVAVKYHVPGLRKVAEEGYQELTETLYGGHGDPSDFANAIKVIYTTTRSNVRDLRTIVESLFDTEKYLLEDESIKDVVNLVPGLAYELLRKAYGLCVADNVTKIPSQRRSRCACGMDCQLEECWQCGLKHRGCSGQCPQMSQEF